jgi:hypothetical protein
MAHRSGPVSQPRAAEARRIRWKTAHATLTTRVCQSDADCTSGGITTALVHCCQETTHSFKACLSACP